MNDNTMNWPDGHRAAAALTFDLDAESAILAFAPEAAARLGVMTHQSYGPRVGLPRLLRVLQRQDVPATFFVPGYTADRYPDAVRQIHDHGHEIAHHGYLHENVVGMTPEQERDVLRRGSDSLEAITGARPQGYRAPMWETNHRTPGLLAEHGIQYDSSLMDDDIPYVLTTEHGELVEIPINWILDDWGQYAYLPELSGTGIIETPEKVTSLWRAELDAMHAEGLCWALVNHPFLSGRPGRAAALERLIEHMKTLEGLWIARMGEIADAARETGDRRSVPLPPEVPGAV